MSKFKSLFHVALHVNDLQKSLEFYQKLGLEYVFDLKAGGEEAEPWVIYMKIAPGQYLELQSIHAETPEGVPDNEGTAFYDRNQTVWHFSFETEDMGTLIRDLTEQGIEVFTAPDCAKRITGIEDTIWGGDGSRVAWIVDPEGTPIELMEQVGQTLQRKYDAEQENAGQMKHGLEKSME